MFVFLYSNVLFLADTADGSEEKTVLVKVRGLFDYVATCDTELSFKEGGIFSTRAALSTRRGFDPRRRLSFFFLL